MNKEHPIHVSANYSYKDRLKKWQRYSTRNKFPFDCKECNKTHAYKTVYLDTGEHVCWFCWIRKDHVFHNAIYKPQEIIKISRPKIVIETTKKHEVKPIKEIIEPVKKVGIIHTNEKDIDVENYYDNIKQCFFTSYTPNSEFIKNKNLNRNKEINND